MKPRIVLTGELTPGLATRLAQEFDALTLSPEERTPEAIVAALARHGAIGLVTVMGPRIDAALVRALPETVRIVATTSVGFDHLDVAALKARGIAVTNTPDVLSDATAEMSFMLMLAACRRAHEYDVLVRAGWGRSMGFAEKLGVQVSGNTLAIVGMGRIGRTMARQARGFGMKVIYHNRRRLSPSEEDGAIWFASLDEMLAQAPILALHAPGGAATEKLLDARRIALLPRGAVVINTSRGTLIDDEALIEALRSGHVFAAGLDVFAGEPTPDPRYAGLPNVILAPHMGSATATTRDAMAALALDNVAAVANGRAALTPL